MSVSLLSGSIGLALLAGWLLLRALWPRGFVLVHPNARDWLREQHLLTPADFLALDAPIVSGHPGRQVMRLSLGGRDLYLKRQQRVGLKERFLNALAGFGWVSRNIREARLLEAMQSAGVSAPRWLAAGEDGRCQSFLLVEAVRGECLVDTLMSLPASRRPLAVLLGEALARLHAAGFCHRDLYSKHVLLGPDDTLTFLDWQRGTQSRRPSIAARVRDLAALHATMPDEAAGPRDRLALLRAYLGPLAEECLTWSRAIERESERMLAHRHVREKRRPARDEQTWICLEGDALCVTPALVELCPADHGRWLALERQPDLDGEKTSRRWISLGEGRTALLVRQRSGSLNALAAAWRSGNGELHRQAMLLGRLRRNGVAAPAVLAMGHRPLAEGGCDAFMLVEAQPEVARLLPWLHHQTPTRRVQALARLGSTLARLHEDCCYLGEQGPQALAVRDNDTGMTIGVEEVEDLRTLRRPDPRRAEGDLAALRRRLEAEGCSPDEWQACVDAYAPSPSVPSLWQRLRHGWRRVRASSGWLGYAGRDWASSIMTLPVTDRLTVKQGRSTGRLVLDAPAGAGRLVVFLKRHHRLGWLRRLLAIVWPEGDWSPAMQEYHHLQWARRHGLPAPAPLASADFIGPGTQASSALVVKELTGMLPLAEAIPLAARRLEPADFRRWKRGLAAELARLARLLHDHGRYHKDFYLCHFFIDTEDTVRVPGDWGRRVWLIDLHRLGHHRRLGWLWAAKDLAQLLFSSDVPGVTLRDRVAFWRHYRRGEGRRAAWHWLRWVVLFKWRCYVRHNRERHEAA